VTTVRRTALDVFRLPTMTRRPGELLGAGREAEIYAWEEGWVLRLAHRGDQRDAVERERLALEAAARAGAPVPQPRGEVVDVDGRPGLVIERLGGRDMLQTLEKKPWRVLTVARASAAAHRAIHAIEAPHELPDARAMIEERVRSSLVPPDLREEALHSLGSLPGGDRLLHGDFHPGNLLPRAGEHVAIDWSGAARGSPDADVARTVVVIRHSALPPGTNAPLAPIGRRILVAAYLRAYGGEPDRRWCRVLTIARLAEDIEGERDGILKAL
jgi:aminoglycoside phosphotransferase (APT) family kinase protein